MIKFKVFMDFAYVRSKVREKQCQRQQEQYCYTIYAQRKIVNMTVVQLVQHHGVATNKIWHAKQRTTDALRTPFLQQLSMLSSQMCSQNANKSLHHVIWGSAPKDQYTSQIENSLSVNLGVLIFNCRMNVTIYLNFSLKLV